MPNRTMPCALWVAGCSISVAILMMIISLATTYWFSLDIDGLQTLHFGLFRVCASDGQCSDFHRSFQGGTDSFLDNKDVSKGLCLAAIIAYGFVLGVMAYTVLGIKLVVRSKNIGWVALIMCILSGISAISSACYLVQELGYPDSTGDSITWKYGYSLYLAAFSGPVSVFSGICFVTAIFRLFHASQPIIQPAFLPVAYVYPTPAQQQYPHQPGPYPNNYNQGFASN